MIQDRAGRACLVAVLVCIKVASAASDETRPPTIAVEILATDLVGKPALTLHPDDLDVRQDGIRQTLTRLERRDSAGLYELRYVPSSGRPGPLTVRPARQGLLVRGPKAKGELQPRIIRSPTALEAELLALAEAPAPAEPLPCDVAVFHFGTGPSGIQHVVAAEVGLLDLVSPTGSVAPPRLQIVARLKREDGSDERLISYDRPVETQTAVDRIVWTSYHDLLEGKHTLEAIVRDGVTRRAAVKKMSFTVPAPGPRLRMSSVVFLQRVPVSLVQAPPADDPFMHKGTPVSPALALTLPHQAETAARFFVLLYPDPRDTSPVTLELEVLRDEQTVGRVPIALPPAENGRIAFVGQVPTRTFRVSAYVLRLIARQGANVVTEDATLRIKADAPARKP